MIWHGVVSRILLLLYDESLLFSSSPFTVGPKCRSHGFHVLFSQLAPSSRDVSPTSESVTEANKRSFVFEVDMVSLVFQKLVTYSAHNYLFQSKIRPPSDSRFLSRVLAYPFPIISNMLRHYSFQGRTGTWRKRRSWNNCRRMAPACTWKIQWSNFVWRPLHFRRCRGH